MNDILRSVKGTGSMFLDHAKLELFMMKTARHMSSQLPSVDVIVCPKSSSAIAKKFAHLIGRYSNAEVIYEAFEKTKFDLPQDREDALNYVVNKFIDVRRFEEEYKADAATKRKELRALASSILNSINKTGKIEMKKIRKSVARFVHNFMSTSSHVNTKLSNKRVLIVDDSFSSGGTMTDMIRHVINNNAKEVFGAVLFLQTT